MTFKSFLIGILCCFTLPWLLIIVIPFVGMEGVEAVRFNEDDDGREEVYVPRRAGRVTDGAKVYAANGCYVCHTQLIRPTYAGTDVWRKDWAGMKATQKYPVDTRRETSVFDYTGEDFAQIGLTRTGPDLSNVGRRIERYVDGRATTPEMWVFKHLYNPRGLKEGYDPKRKTMSDWSTCPAQRFMFREVKLLGQGTADALPVKTPGDTQLLPKQDARALASYLLSLKKDDPVPYSMDYSRDKKRAIEQ
jgi:cytochrome c oxidase cbb3-type subunit 2